MRLRSDDNVQDVTPQGHDLDVMQPEPPSGIELAVQEAQREAERAAMAYLLANAQQ